MKCLAKCFGRVVIVAFLLAFVVAKQGSTAWATEIGHFTVTYLGTIFDGDIATARWAVTDNGCPPGQRCNTMSHIAFRDFLCGPSDRIWPDPNGVLPFWTVTDPDECADGTYTCLEAAYQPVYGASKPDGPGSWIKFSERKIDPKTVQLKPGFTHVFSITFWDDGGYVYDDPDGSPMANPVYVTDVAVKFGNVVVHGTVQAPACAP